MLEELCSLKEHYMRCVRCGQCRAACPVFEEIRNETASPRGKVFLAYLLSGGEIGADAETASKMSLCLLCRTCSQECPSAVPVHQIVAAARSHLAKKKPLELRRLLFKEIWTRPALLNLSAGLLRRCQAFGLLNLGIALHLLPRGLSLPGRLPGRPARAAISEITPAAGRPKMRIGYFLGCSTNFLFPGLAKATVAVLSRLGCEVATPENLKCCGLPQVESGEAETAALLAKANFEAFRRLGVKAVVSDCASCTAALKESPLRSEFPEIKILDLSGLLVELVKSNKPPLTRIQKPVTYHDPCHLARAQGITGSPRELLQMTGADFREMPGASDCCGGGGTFALYHYQTSMGILNKKIASIKKTEAEVVASCCPTCLMQIRHGLSKSGSSTNVSHPVQLLAQSLGLQY